MMEEKDKIVFISSTLNSNFIVFWKLIKMLQFIKLELVNNKLYQN